MGQAVAHFEWEARGEQGWSMGRVGAVRVAPDGRIWTAEAGGRFFIFDSSGAFLEVWGDEGRAPGQFTFLDSTPSAEARLDVKVDFSFFPDGPLVVLEPALNRLQLFSAERRLLRSWGSAEGGIAAPQALAIGPDGIIYVAFSGQAGLQRFDSDGAYLGTLPLGLDQKVSGVAIDASGRIYIATELQPEVNVRPKGLIREFDRQGRPIAVFGSQKPGFGGLSFDMGLALDGAGRLVVADEWNQRIVVFDPEGRPILVWGSAGDGPGEFNRANSAAFDASGNIYVSDLLNRRIEKFALSGL